MIVIIITIIYEKCFIMFLFRKKVKKKKKLNLFSKEHKKASNMTTLISWDHSAAMQKYF